MPMPVSASAKIFTEQVEILRDPARLCRPRHHRRRGSTIVTKQRPMKKASTTWIRRFGHRPHKRVVLDVNQVITRPWQFRAGGSVQDAGVAGRDLHKDDRDGGSLQRSGPARHRELYATTSTPICTFA